MAIKRKKKPEAEPTKPKRRALGMTCGIGSMLIGARAAGFDVIGNIEWRTYYHTGTFEHNFPGAFMIRNPDDLTEEQLAASREIDLIMGHTECGSYSQLQTSKNKKDLVRDPGDIPEFVEAIQVLRPTFFVMDNLPKSILGYTPEEWIAKLGDDYDLFFEWVSNYNYGNVQKMRRRMFVIGAKKGLGYVFHPGEFPFEGVFEDVVSDLPKDRDIPELNHIHPRDEDPALSNWLPHNFGLPEGHVITLADVKDHIRDWPNGKNFPYRNLSGEDKTRPGYFKIRIARPAPVMTGGGGTLDNHFWADSLNPLTIRERARAQGFPDDFIFLPLDYTTDKGKYRCVYRQTGKSMPIQFCTYVAKQILEFLETGKLPDRSSRMLDSNPYVDSARIAYCQSKGYGDAQPIACRACSTPGCPVRVATSEVILPEKKPKVRTPGSGRRREKRGLSLWDFEKQRRGLVPAAEPETEEDEE